MKDLFYDKQGKPLDLIAWGRLVEHGGMEYKRVGYFDGLFWRVSTVWIGLDNSFLGGPPLIFETMVFSNSRLTEWLCDHWSEQACDHYSTLAQAKGGHLDAVEAWSEVRGFREVLRRIAWKLGRDIE